MLKTDVVALCRVNGMAEADALGSYVKLVYHDHGENRHLIISEGCAENLAQQLIGVLSQRDQAVLAKIMRNVRSEK